MGSEVPFNVCVMTWGLRKVLRWCEDAGEGQGTNTPAEAWLHLQAALRSGPQQPRRAAASLTHSNRACLDFCFPSLNKGLTDAYPAGSATKALGIKKRKQKQSERRVLTEPETISLQGYKEQGHRESGTRWRPRLYSRSWVSQVVRGTLALPFFPLQRRAQEGA